jgi:hypothetical protein
MTFLVGKPVKRKKAALACTMEYVAKDAVTNLNEGGGDDLNIIIVVVTP